jgi:hypothetical protein
LILFWPDIENRVEKHKSYELDAIKKLNPVLVLIGTDADRDLTNYAGTQQFNQWFNGRHNGFKTELQSIKRVSECFSGRRKNIRNYKYVLMSNRRLKMKLNNNKFQEMYEKSYTCDLESKDGF